MKKVFGVSVIVLTVIVGFTSCPVNTDSFNGEIDDYYLGDWKMIGEMGDVSGLNTEFYSYYVDARISLGKTHVNTNSVYDKRKHTYVNVDEEVTVTERELTFEYGSLGGFELEGEYETNDESTRSFIIRVYRVDSDDIVEYKNHRSSPYNDEVFNKAMEISKSKKVMWLRSGIHSYLNAVNEPYDEKANYFMYQE